MPDLISSVYLAGLVLLVLAAREHITDWRWLLARYAILLILQAGWLRAEAMVCPGSSPLLPVGPILGIYDSLRFIPELNPGDRDDLLDLGRPSRPGRRPERLA
jgi:hypothetical protein